MERFIIRIRRNELNNAGIYVVSANVNVHRDSRNTSEMTERIYGNR